MNQPHIYIHYQLSKKKNTKQYVVQLCTLYSVHSGIQWQCTVYTVHSFKELHTMYTVLYTNVLQFNIDPIHYTQCNSLYSVAID